MEKSFYQTIIGKWFKGIASKVVEKINGTKEAPKYLFTQYLKKKFSVDLNWKSLSSSKTIVSASVVSLDSELPLVKRDYISSASGTIPKVGLELFLNEKQLQDIDIMRATNVQESEIIAKIFEDTPRVVGGVMERLEASFLQGLSTGEIVIEDKDNVGTGISADFGIPNSNKFGVIHKWSDPESKPIDDIKRILDEAQSKGDVLSYMWIDQKSFDLLRSNKQIKELYAFKLNFVGDRIPNLDREGVKKVFLDEVGLNVILINRTVIFEKNGKRTPVKPWKEGNATFTVTSDVGSLQWGNLAEMNHPVEGVEYQRVDDYMLVSKYRTNKPMREYTSVQANVLPVIENADNTYIMSVLDAYDTDNQTEGDDNVDLTKETISSDGTISINDQDVSKTALVSALISLEVEGVSNSSTDVELVEAVNQLSEEDKALLKDELGIS